MVRFLVAIMLKNHFSYDEEPSFSNANISLQISHNSNVNSNSFYIESNTINTKIKTEFQTSEIEVYFHE